MKKSLLVAVVGAALLSLLLGSCATIVSGTKESVSIKSTPPGTVKVTASNGQVFYTGSTPKRLRLPRGNTYTVEVTVPGYKSQTIQITHGFNNWFIGNIIFGGIPGGVVDAIDGAMWTLEPSTIDLRLVKKGGSGQNAVALVGRALNRKGEPVEFVLPLTPIN